MFLSCPIPFSTLQSIECLNLNLYQFQIVTIQYLLLMLQALIFYYQYKFNSYQKPQLVNLNFHLELYL